LISFPSSRVIIYGYFAKYSKASYKLCLRSILLFDRPWVGTIFIEEEIKWFFDFQYSGNFGFPDQLVIGSSKYWESKSWQFHNQLVMAALHLFLDLEYFGCARINGKKAIQHRSCDPLYWSHSICDRLECDRN
jgi:hypothetical protein